MRRTCLGQFIVDRSSHCCQRLPQTWSTRYFPGRLSHQSFGPNLGCAAPPVFACCSGRYNGRFLRLRLGTDGMADRILPICLVALLIAAASESPTAWGQNDELAALRKRFAERPL